MDFENPRVLKVVPFANSIFRGRFTFYIQHLYQSKRMQIGYSFSIERGWLAFSFNNTVTVSSRWVLQLLVSLEFLLNCGTQGAFTVLFKPLQLHCRKADQMWEQLKLTETRWPTHTLVWMNLDFSKLFSKAFSIFWFYISWRLADFWFSWSWSGKNIIIFLPFTENNPFAIAFCSKKEAPVLQWLPLAGFYCSYRLCCQSSPVYGVEHFCNFWIVIFGHLLHSVICF